MLDSKHGLRGHVVSISKLYYINYDEKVRNKIYIFKKIDYQKKKKKKNSNNFKEPINQRLTQKTLIFLNYNYLCVTIFISTRKESQRRN